MESFQSIQFSFHRCNSISFHTHISSVYVMFNLNHIITITSVTGHRESWQQIHLILRKCKTQLVGTQGTETLGAEGCGGWPEAASAESAQGMGRKICQGHGGVAAPGHCLGGYGKEHFHHTCFVNEWMNACINEWINEWTNEYQSLAFNSGSSFLITFPLQSGEWEPTKIKIPFEKDLTGLPGPVPSYVWIPLQHP